MTSIGTKSASCVGRGCTSNAHAAAGWRKLAPRAAAPGDSLPAWGSSNASPLQSRFCVFIPLPVLQMVGWSHRRNKTIHYSHPPLPSGGRRQSFNRPLACNGIGAASGDWRHYSYPPLPSGGRHRPLGTSRHQPATEGRCQLHLQIAPGLNPPPKSGIEPSLPLFGGWAPFYFHSRDRHSSPRFLQVASLRDVADQPVRIFPNQHHSLPPCYVSQRSEEFSGDVQKREEIYCVR